MWNDVQLKANDKNLPPIGERVLYAQYDKEHNGFHQFIGSFSTDGYIVKDSGNRVKLTSMFYWMLLPEEPR